MNKLLITFWAILLSINLCYPEELGYDYTSTRVIPIELSPVKEITTKQKHLPGEKVEFKANNSVYDNGKIILKKGDIINAALETDISSGMNGFPAEIIIDKFKIPGISQSKLLSTYSKAGQNRCLIVYPIKWMLTPIPLAGSLTNFIKGGHARLKPSDTVIIYYYPDWK